MEKKTGPKTPRGGGATPAPGPAPARSLPKTEPRGPDPERGPPTKHNCLLGTHPARMEAPHPGPERFSPKREVPADSVHPEPGPKLEKRAQLHPGTRGTETGFDPERRPTGMELLVLCPQRNPAKRRPEPGPQRANQGLQRTRGPEIHPGPRPEVPPWFWGAVWTFF